MEFACLCNLSAIIVLVADMIVNQLSFAANIPTGIVILGIICAIFFILDDPEVSDVKYMYRDRLFESGLWRKYSSAGV